MEHRLQLELRIPASNGLETGTARSALIYLDTGASIKLAEKAKQYIRKPMVGEGGDFIVY